MWDNIESYWQEAFKMAWKSYKNGTIPIGAVTVDSQNNIISKGRNRIYDKNSKHVLAGTYMAHAETSALMELKEIEHPEIKTYRMYSTMEPCPMCFGTIVMMGIRNLCYAARDGFAGATELNEKMAYIKSKGINICRGERELEVFQLVMQSSFECNRRHPRMEELFDSWREYCNEAIDLGKKLFDEEYFLNAVEKDKDISDIYDEVMSRYYSEYGYSEQSMVI